MKMVLETIEDNIACLISDAAHFPAVYIHTDKLPSDAILGDVFEVEVELPSFKPVKLIKVRGEREERLEKMKKKREFLLKRSQDE